MFALVSLFNKPCFSLAQVFSVFVHPCISCKKIDCIPEIMYILI